MSKSKGKSKSKKTTVQTVETIQPPQPPLPPQPPQPQPHVETKQQTKTPHVSSVIIIGGGCAGLTAALYAARAELNPIVFTGNLEDKGGLLVKTSIVENYPGFSDGILGYDLVTNMEAQAVKFGTVIKETYITEINLKSHPKRLVDSNGDVYYTLSVIIATGSTPNKLKIEREDELWSKGISSCAVCDGALYKKKKIIVVGGGDSAMEEAEFLTKFSDVTLIHRGDSFTKASKIMQKKVLDNKKIHIIYNTVITKLNGTSAIESVLCQDNKTGNTFELKVDGLFYGLGLKPNSNLFKNVLDVDNDGYILTKVSESDKHNDFNTMTSIDGVFVAGDVHDTIYRQAIVACGDGCRAAMDSIKWCQKFSDDYKGDNEGCVFN